MTTEPYQASYSEPIISEPDFEVHETGANIWQCPNCGAPVTDRDRGFGCSNWRDKDGGCRFTIWKTISGKEITKEIAAQLLTEKKTPILDGFISKAGKPFSAGLKLIQEEGKWKVGFEFQNESSEILGKCPTCGGNVIEGNKGFGCANWRDKDGGCKFVIWKTMSQKEIPKTAVTQLLETGATDILLGFISKKGDAFSAKLKLSQDASGIHKVVFEFPQDRLPNG